MIWSCTKGFSRVKRIVPRELKGAAMGLIRAGFRDSADLTAGSPRPACSAHAADVDFEFLESIRKRKRYLGDVVRVVVQGAIQWIPHSEIQPTPDGNLIGGSDCPSDDTAWHTA